MPVAANPGRAPLWVVSSCTVILVLLAGLTALVPRAEAEQVASVVTAYGSPVQLEVPSQETGTIQFSGAEGDRVSVGIRGDWTAEGQVRLYAPSTAVILADDLLSGATDPIELSETGTYTIEAISTSPYATSLEITVHRADVVNGDLTVDGAPSRFRLGVGDSLALSMEASEGDVVSIWPPGLMDWNEVDGFYDSTMQLIDPDGTTVVWDSSTSSTPYQPVMEAVAMPSTGMYTLRVEPWLGAEGHLSLQAATVIDFTSPLLENERAISELRVPGQDAYFTIAADGGDWIRISCPLVPDDSDLVLEGPGGQVWHAGASSGGFDDLFIAQTGVYRLRVDGHQETGEVRVRYQQVPPAAVVPLPMDGTPVTATPSSDRQRLRFGLQAVPSTEVDIEITSDATAEGQLLRLSPGSATGEWAGRLRPGGKSRVGFWEEGGVADEYGMVYHPFEGSRGSVTARVSPASTPPDPLYGEIHSDGGFTALGRAESQYTAEVNPGTTYRLALQQDDAATAHLTVSGEGVFVSSTINSTESIVEFTTPAAADPSMLEIRVVREPSEEEPSNGTVGAIELYSFSSTPQFLAYSGPVAPEDVEVRWAVDAIGAAVEGYAVMVDDNPGSDPGTSITQSEAEARPTLPPGEHWLHVRAINGVNLGPVAHTRILVAGSGVPTTPPAPIVSPGTPGLVATQEPTLSVNVPSSVTAAEAVRFIVRSTDSGRFWSGDAAVYQSEAKLAVPGRVLTGNGPFEAFAQYLDEEGVPSTSGPVVTFRIDLLAPQVPAPACTHNCMVADYVLFDGTLPGGATELMDVESLTDIGAGNWAESVDLEIEATGVNGALLRFNSGIADPGEETPTLLVPTGETATVRVVPDDIYQVSLVNSASQAADIRVTAVGWTPALNEQEEAEQEAAIEEVADAYLANGMTLAEEQPPTVDEYVALPETVCSDDGACVSFVGPDAQIPVPQALGGEQGLDGTARASSLTPRSADSGEPLNCQTGEETGRWILEDRFNACAVFKALLFKGMLPIQGSNFVEMRVNHRVRLSPRTSIVKYAFKITVLRAYGDTGLVPFRAGVGVTCTICVGGDIAEKHTQYVAGLPGAEESNWVEHAIPIDVSVGDMSPLTSMAVDFDDPDSGLEHRILMDWRIEVPWIPQFPGARQQVHVPPIRCDGGNPAITGAKKGPGTHGCVFPFSAAPILSIDPDAVPNHAALVTVGQRDIWGHPGDPTSNAVNPLIRIPTWDHSGAKPRRSLSVRRNRERARKMCIAARVKRPATCDEYPYASTANGCHLAMLAVGDNCSVRGVSKEENSRAGGALGAFIRLQRLLPGDSYFVDASGSSEPQ